MTRLLLIVTFIALALMMSSARLMNKRERIPDQFEIISRTEANHLLEFRLALRQKNMEILKATLLDVSDPDSPNYGKWWTREQILDLITPSIDEINPVVSWLKSHNGVKEIDVSGRDVIKVKALVGTIEKMFRTQMHNYRSLETGKIVSRVFGSVHVPDHLDVIDMVTGLTELVPKLSTRTKSIQKRKLEQNTDPLGIIYPDHLRDMYVLPSEFAVNEASSFGVMELQSDVPVDYSDLLTFNQYMNEQANVSNNLVPNNEGDPTPEASTHVEYGASLALNTSFWYWTLENWLYEGATDLFNAESHPLIVVISTGPNQYSEAWQCNITTIGCTTTDQSFVYVNKVDYEFMKIGLRGITLLTGAGDQGAPGSASQECITNQIANVFPASSQWITSVGSTMLTQSSRASNNNRQSSRPPVCQHVKCASVSSETVETYPVSSTTSGGGFSAFSTMPTWQTEYVNAYLKSVSHLPYGQFNPSYRAYPDVAANGHNYGCIDGGDFDTFDGSSASATTVGAVISLLNSYLLNNGKNSIGFANPLLYKMYAADKTTFTDITGGSNYCSDGCCGDVGFVATKGWDAVSGLGTPIFPKMQQYLKQNVVEKI